MTLIQEIEAMEEKVLYAEVALAEAIRDRCSSAAGWRDELKRRRAALAKLKKERDNV